MKPPAAAAAGQKRPPQPGHEQAWKGAEQLLGSVPNVCACVRVGMRAYVGMSVILHTLDIDHQWWGARSCRDVKGPVKRAKEPF